MLRRTILFTWSLNIAVVTVGLVMTHRPAAAASAGDSSKPAATGESIDALYEKAKKEGGKLVLYAPLSTRTQDYVLPIFEKRFPGSRSIMWTPPPMLSSPGR